MSEQKHDQLLQAVQELTTTVADHKAQGDTATVEIDKLAGELKTLHAELADVRQQLAEHDTPDRKGEGRDVFEVGADKGVAVPHAFKGVDPKDLILAEKLLTAASDRSGRPSKALRQAVSAVKAMDTDTSSAGAELLDRDLTPMVWDDIFPATNIAQTIPQYNMSTDPYDIPLNLGDITFRKGTQNTATTATDPTTADSTLTSTELVAEVNWSYSLDEDAVIAMMPEVRRTLVRNAAQYLDRFALNADATNAGTGNINSDDADPADDSYYLSDGQDGIRHLWLVDNTDQQVNAGTGITDAEMRSLFALLGKYFQDALEDVIVVPDYQTYLEDMLGLSNVVTVDKFGPQATVLTGQLAAYMGVPVIPSAFHPRVEADGKASDTSSNNTLGSITAYNRLMWASGYRRQPLIEIDRDIQTRQFVMVASMRYAIGARVRTSATHTAGIRNI